LQGYQLALSHGLLNHESNAPDILIDENRRPVSIRSLVDIFAKVAEVRNGPIMLKKSFRGGE
jgi:hypothetical protein